MQGYLSRRQREQQKCAGREFWDVISTLTQDLTKARNQLARLMEQAKSGCASLHGGDCGSRPSPQYNSIRSYTPCAGSHTRNRPRIPPPGHLGCGKQYPHSDSPSPEPSARRPCRPMTVSAASPQRPPFAYNRPQHRVPYSCERSQKKELLQYSCWKPQMSNSCSKRQQQCSHRSSRRKSSSNYVEIYFNPPGDRGRCRRSTRTCKGGNSSPARLQGGGRRHMNCIGTQFASLLQDATSHLRERRLAADSTRIQ